MKKLELYTSYNREEIHDILSPNTKFTKSAGTWGLQGLVSVLARYKGWHRHRGVPRGALRAMRDGVAAVAHLAPAAPH